ncbi:MAG: NAD(P)-dependent glycerol-3-phosphate dehydrogenase [Planctomycetes bacterium]|nr:NAD(P)-dependent glycerol-3-phosphate dehydrogenase [Planctomycetota bacterium]
MVDRALTTTVLGDGGWGTALSIVLASNGHKVTLWGAFPDYIEEMRRIRVNRKFLPEVDIPSTVRLSHNIAEALWEASIVVFAVPTQFLRSVAEKVRTSGYDPAAIIVTVSKGIEVGTLKRGSEIISDVLGSDIHIGGLFGPSHAEEVARRLPTTVSAACRERGIAVLLQEVFSGPFFRVYTNSDLVGSEVCGAVKNVLAIACGISDGLGLGDNARAAILTRGLAEMARLAGALGADPITVTGLTGVGDLVVTCHSLHSRNRRVGIRIAQGETLDQIVRSSEQVAEGVESSRSIRDLASRAGVEMPIVNAVAQVLFEGKSPRQAAWELMNRDPKAELEEFRQTARVD